MKYFPTTNYFETPIEIDSLPEGQFLFRKGYAKIQEESSKFGTICVYFLTKVTRKMMYVPLDACPKEIQTQYKTTFIELNRG